MSWSERSWADGPRWPTVRSGAPEKLHFLAHGTRRLVVGALSPDSRPTHTQPLSVKERPRSQNHSHPGEMRLKPYPPKLHQLSEANHKLVGACFLPKTKDYLSTDPCPCIVPSTSNSLGCFPPCGAIPANGKMHNRRWTDWQMAIAKEVALLQIDCGSFFKLSYKESLSLKRQRPVAWDEPRLGSRSSVSVSFLERPHLGQHCHQSRSLSPDTTRLLLRTIGAKVSTPLPASSPISSHQASPLSACGQLKVGASCQPGSASGIPDEAPPCHPHQAVSP